MFPGANAKVHVVQNHSIAARDIHLTHLKKTFRLWILRHSPSQSIVGSRFAHLLD